MSGPFVNSFTVGHKHSLLDRDNLTKPIKMQLSQKQKKLSQFFSVFLRSRLNFGHFQKKDDPHS